MSNCLFAFCEDSYTALGVPFVVIIYHDAQGKLVAYVYSPKMSSLIKAPKMDMYLTSPKLELTSIKHPYLSTEIKFPMIQLSYPDFRS